MTVDWVSVWQAARLVWMELKWRGYRTGPALHLPYGAHVREDGCMTAFGVVERGRSGRVSFYHATGPDGWRWEDRNEAVLLSRLARAYPNTRFVCSWKLPRMRG